MGSLLPGPSPQKHPPPEKNFRVRAQVRLTHAWFAVTSRTAGLRQTPWGCLGRCVSYRTTHTCRLLKQSLAFKSYPRLRTHSMFMFPTGPRRIVGELSDSCRIYSRTLFELPRRPLTLEAYDGEGSKHEFKYIYLFGAGAEPSFVSTKLCTKQK